MPKLLAISQITGGVNAKYDWRDISTWNECYVDSNQSTLCFICPNAPDDCIFIYIPVAGSNWMWQTTKGVVQPGAAGHSDYYISFVELSTGGYGVPSGITSVVVIKTLEKVQDYYSSISDATWSAFNEGFPFGIEVAVYSIRK